MSRFARESRVFFVEEPVFEGPSAEPRLTQTVCDRTGVRVVTPILPQGLSSSNATAAQRRLLDDLMVREQIKGFVSWYYTPMALEFSRHLHPPVTVYDCMDELSAFAGAPPALKANELELFQRAGLVFTGGASLYEAKRRQHASVHLFPSSVDVAHFQRARSAQAEPTDQVGISKPRLGYAGVIDERMDVELLRQAAALRPDWQFVMIGPVVKIDPASLPQAPNIHYLGMKAYGDLPTYFAGWNIGLLPFALNESTRYISPTKTPEYLAAGLHVISTPIRDVAVPYGELGLARIVSNARDFVSVAEDLLNSPFDSAWAQKADLFLSNTSWDRTWGEMHQLIDGAYLARAERPTVPGGEKVRAEGAHV